MDQGMILANFTILSVFSNVTRAPSWTETTSQPSTSTPLQVQSGIPFAQRKFLSSSTFRVPEGVSVVDVICIGAGGGGRNNLDKWSYGSNGGNSSFGDYLYAEGGSGANNDDSGGKGGWGLTANGGDGGKGGGCSAGAGAAGETTPGDGYLKAGSSVNLFCGGGAGRGCVDSGIPQATSGPGGVDPDGNIGGKYGGGGGSRGGGRTGGGGGFSRKLVQVTAGEEIAITVGKGGHAYYWWDGDPGDGIVVVAWGGHIDPNKPFQ